MTDFDTSTNSSEMNKICATYFYDNTSIEKPTIIQKEFSTSIIFQTIAEDISSYYKYTFGEQPTFEALHRLVNGYVLFNLHKNKYMLNSKVELLKYINNGSISIEEKDYFLNIFLYKQKPSFLTLYELECIRACGTLDM
jgi:hypothetical protein